MKILASSSNYLIRIVDSNVDEDAISEFLRTRNSYISSYNPFLEISGPDRECDDVIYFLTNLGLMFNVY